MSSDVLQQALVAGVVATFPRGRIFNLLQAAAQVSVVAEYRGTGQGQTKHKVFNNIPAGSKFTADPADGSWTYLRVTSAVNQTITLYVGDDDMAFNNAVTITGVALVGINPSSSINSPAQSVLAGNTTDGTGVPANAARRRVTVYNLAASLGPIRLSDTGATTRGFEVAPGGYAEVDTTAAIGIRCDTANGATWGYFEES
jgi:hypothetical protein